MKNRFSLILLAAMLSLAALTPFSTQAAVSSWQKGASIRSMWNGDFGSAPFKQSVDNLAATGANYVSLVFPLYQANLYTTDIYSGGDTPTDAALESAIDYIHSKGMKVMLKPHLESQSGEWRALINPSNRGAWFSSYGNFMEKYARMAQSKGVADFCLGTELINMASTVSNGTNTQNWKSLISRIRGVYTGKLTYSANWGEGDFADEKNHIDFWGDLDYIGISAYYNLYGDNSVANLKSQWAGINSRDITPLQQKWNKPVVFTEVGYKSTSGAHQRPWDYSFGGGADETEQANAYTALFDYWNGQGFMQGVQLWEWKSDPNAGGPGNGDYTPQRKQAEGVIKQWFGGAGTPVPPGNSATYSTSASANPSTVSNGQSTTITANVTANGGTGAGIIVDVEIYNSAGQQVKQQVFDNQMFASGQTKTFNVSFTPPTSATYTVKIGIFNYNWSQLYNWNDNAATFGSSGGSSGGGGGGTPPPPASWTMDIWWPTNSANIGGSAVPFKGLVRDRDVSTYDMFWQVDGGPLVSMPTDMKDWPHKEFVANVTGWTWKGNGPYTINFIAKDKSGNTLVTKNISVTVWH